MASENLQTVNRKRKISCKLLLKYFWCILLAGLQITGKVPVETWAYLTHCPVVVLLLFVLFVRLVKCTEAE